MLDESWRLTPAGSSGRREAPIKGKYAEEFCPRHASAPATFRAGNLLLSEELDGVAFGEGCSGALPLQINRVAALWAFEDDLVSLAHRFNDSTSGAMTLREM